MNIVSFPGLGIKWFHVDNVAFTVFGKDVAWYGIIICIGIILAVLYSYLRAKKEGISSDDISNIAIFLVLFGVLGGRLYYVLFELKNYIVTDFGFFENFGKSFIKIISVWNGGLAIYGALIAGFFTIVIYCRKKKIPVLKMLDIAAPAAMIGQLVGRWGNFTNVEAYGYETTLPWRMGIATTPFDDLSMGVINNPTYVHPTFLYESLWNLLGFALVFFLLKKRKKFGQIFFFYISWYGAGRMIIEGLRTDSLYLGPIRISQLVGLLCLITGIVFIILSYIKRFNLKFLNIPAEDYYSKKKYV